MFKNFLSGNYFVENSKIIEKPAKTVFNKICDLKSWNSWNPGILHEPDTKIIYSEKHNQEGGYYAWDGKIIGAGKIMHEEIIEPNKINQRLEFIRPFRSVCQMTWKFKELKKNQTRVTWIMSGKAPFLFRWMIPTIKRECKKDFEFGLTVLNGKLDSNAEYPTVTFGKEPVYREEQKYLIQSFQGYLNELPKEMSGSFGKMMEHIKKNDLEINHQAACLYHKVNPKTGAVKCDFAIPVEGKGSSGEFAFKTLPRRKYAQTTLKGNYNFLETAWRKAFEHSKMKKHKCLWKYPCIEAYANDPRKVKKTNNYLTEIYIPIK